MTGLKPHALTDADIEAYRRDGHVVPGYRLPAVTLDRMRRALVALEAANPHMTTDFVLCPHLPDPSVQKVTGSPEWMEFAILPDILNMVEQLIGPDIILWGTTVFGKPARTGKKTPWHQDANYWPMKPAHTCTAWIALDDATLENGCLQVIPGSHRNERSFKHNINDDGGATLNQEIDAAEYDEAVAHYEQADHANTMYVRYHLGLALAGAGQEDRAKTIFREVGEWNFNSVGFALVRKDALERAGTA